MICPNCGEDNSAAFRFCGMCGTPLASQPLVPGAAATSPNPAPGAVPGAHQARERRTDERVVPVLLEMPQKAESQAAAIAGPSLLGLGPDLDAGATAKSGERPFNGINSFLEPEEPKTSGRRIVLLLAMLVALGAAGWWAYSNFVGATSRSARAALANQGAATSNPGAAPAPPNTAAAKPQELPAGPAPSPAASASQPGTPVSAAHPAAAPDKKAQAASAKPSPPPAKKQSASPKAAESVKPAASVTAPRPNTAHSEPPAPASGATAAPSGGEADYRKGEAYLYGRGVAENCDEAVKHLKAASAKQNAKARSTFGTMYATGHCVPRDLPTSYGWFALALHVDPSNQILEKDLTAIWNQMTPPERQMATKMKP